MTHRSSRRRPPRGSALRRFLVLAVAALLAAVVLAPSGLAAAGIGAQVKAATRAATRAAERESVRMQREASRAARKAAKRQAREALRLALKEKDGNVVAIDCTKVAVEYSHFPSIPGSPNQVMEWITIKNPPPSIASGPVAFPPRVFSFEGTSGTDVVPIAFPVGHYTIDVHAKWNDQRRTWQLRHPRNVTCEPNPAFTIREAAGVARQLQPLTEAPLSGSVGQTVIYEMLVTNTGNTPLTFSTLSDTRCDPGTIAGGDDLARRTARDRHLRLQRTRSRRADESAGSVTNIATVTGTPEEGEGARKTRIEHRRRDPVSAPPKEEEPKKKKNRRRRRTQRRRKTRRRKHDDDHHTALRRSASSARRP